MMNYLKLSLGLLAILTTLFFVSCSDDEGDTPTKTNFVIAPSNSLITNGLDWF